LKKVPTDQRVPRVPVTQMFVSSIGLGLLGERARDSLMVTDEFPEAGWTMTSQVSYRTLDRINTSEEDRRARRDGSITGRRRYLNSSSKRKLEIVVIPYTSVEDANASLQRRPELFYRSPFRRAFLLNQKVVDPATFPDLADAVLSEAEIRNSRGISNFKFVGRSAGRLLVAMYFRAPVGSWTWNEIATIANLQASKARPVVGGSDESGK